MDDFRGVKMCEALECDFSIIHTYAKGVTNPQNLSAHISNPLLFNAIRFGALDEICDAAAAAELHHQPQLVVFAIARGQFLDENAIVCGDVAVVRVLAQHVDFELDFLFLILIDVHDLNRRKLASFEMSTLHIAPLVLLSLSSFSSDHSNFAFS